MAIDQLNIEVLQGEIFGFLGPNGAGKTTTIRLLLDLIRPTYGSAMVFGMDCFKASLETRKKIGYLPGELNLYRRSNGRDLLKLFSSLKPNQISQKYVSSICERLDVDLETQVSNLSHGNRQKIGLVLALMSRPELIILDEPTNGFDPLVRHQVLGLLREARSEGRTVFFSSHVLSEVEQICDRVGIIRKGHLVTVEQVQMLRKRLVSLIHINFAEVVPPGIFSSLSDVKLLDCKGKSVNLEVNGDIDAVVKIASRYHVVSFESEQPALEEVFMRYYMDNSSKLDQEKKLGNE
jgi:ABC-2 type transport system ATP-binding protein